MKDYCQRCKSTQETKAVNHTTGTEYHCDICGWQVDYFINEQIEDDNDPTGSCENCGTNLYSEDDPEFCNQCLWQMEN